MLRFLISAFIISLYCSGAAAQMKSELKQYPRGTVAGEVALLQQWTEYDGVRSSTCFAIDVPVSACYAVAAIANLQQERPVPVQVDGQPAAYSIYPSGTGWQRISAASTARNQGCGIYLAAGRHVLSFPMEGNMPPLMDELSCSRSGAHTQLDADWGRLASRLAQWAAEKPLSVIPESKTEAVAGKVLNNPAGAIEHAIDTAFGYTTMQWVYLTAGSTYTFTTTGSTKDPVLHLFDPANIDTRSWWNDDSNGGWECTITVTIPASATYALLVRPYYGNQSGTTNLYQNGALLLANAPIGGLRFATTPRTGERNYFTARLSGTTPDTRIFTLGSSGTGVTGYNDDYTNTSSGTWSWGLASRIRKNYAAGSSCVFVCAYSAARTGSCDVYMGTTASQLVKDEPGNFPLLTAEDAMQNAPFTYDYNCIAWSGGITTSWVWPLDQTSTWYVANNPLAGFDKYYSNTPLRYPGAWNYTRSGATAANAAVDLWKKNSAYTHGSVTKPGNDHPHGYDWESKPGGFDRTYHPRNALQNANWYGAVTDYYRFAGTYGKNLSGMNTDMDAVEAGLAVIEKANLTNGAQQKLTGMLSRTEPGLADRFEFLYKAWDHTKEKNRSLSDPFMYCNNTEFERMAAFCQQHPQAGMLLVFDKYVNAGDHFIGKLMLSLTTARYGHLLDEVKQERLANPNDAAGRYKIHGDHDNGVLYIEKILQQLQEVNMDTPSPETVVVTVSPNPVNDLFTVQVTLKKEAVVSVKVVSGQRSTTSMLQTATTLPAGIHRFNGNAAQLRTATGDMIAVQVTINGVLQTVKVLKL